MEHIVPQIERELRAKYSQKMMHWYEMIDWKEPLVLELLTFHTLLAATVFFTRKRLLWQFLLFLLIILLLLVTEELNKWGRANWKVIASQQYFDERGVFMGLFYAGPLLAIGFFQLLLSMKSMVNMIIIVKRAEFQQQQKTKKAKKE